MEKEIINLPLIIGGEEVDGSSKIQLEYDDLIINFPALNDETREKVLSMDGNKIHDLKVNDIALFFEKVAKLWFDENYPLRKQLLEYGPRISGQTPEMYNHNIAVMLQIILPKGYMEDIVEYELGDRRLLDEWITKENAEIHAEPLGKILHIISGNVSLAGFYSIIRGILTKNVNIVKLSQKDFLASYLLIKSFADVDPQHPITKAVSAVYWGRDDFTNIDYFTRAVNGMVVWGGYDTIKTYKSRCRVGCEFIEYGPKKGIQIIDNTNNIDKQIILNVARDISVFDQEACLSPQLILIKGGDIKRFIYMLWNGLYKYSQLWPVAKHSVDHYIHMNYLLKSHEYLGNFVWTDVNRERMIVKLDNIAELKLEHPLGRTIFIKEIQDFDECMEYIDESVQTVGIAPKSLARKLRDQLTRRGVTRIANIGEIELPREGLVHEGINLSRLVHLVGMDKEAEYYSKTYDMPAKYFEQFIFSLVCEQKGESK